MTTTRQTEKTTEMKNIFIIDWWLVFTFTATAISGFVLHIAEHFWSHATWHYWAVCHTLTALLFIFSGVLHIKTHWGWYKNLLKRGIGNKSRITLCLTFIFAIASVTGIVLLNVEGGNSKMGIWHYKIGIILSLIAIWHLIKRFPILLKSINKQ